MSTLHQRLAERFGELLLAELGQARYDELCKLQAETGKDCVYAFCDPTNAMYRAFKEVRGRDPIYGRSDVFRMELAREIWRTGIMPNLPNEQYPSGE